MSNENNNNDDEDLQTKTISNLKDKEILKVSYNLNPVNRNNKKRISNLEISKKMPILEDTDSASPEKTSKELKKNLTKRTKTAKKKKKKKKKEAEPVLLTEVKPELIPKKVEEEKKESIEHKFLREKLEKLNFSKGLRIGIDSGFEKINMNIRENIENNFNIRDKKINLDNIINKNNKKNIELNTGKNGILYNINKESILRLKHLKQNEKNIKKKLDKIEESQKMLESEEPIKSDKVNINVRNNNLKKINSMKNELLVKLRYNSSIISEVIDKDKNINRNLLIQNYNNHTNKTETGCTKHFSLSEDQEKFNKYLLKKQEEEKLQREKIQNALKRSNSKKSKEIELNEQKILERQKEHLNELKKKEKDFFNKLKEKNNLLFEKSIKNIDKNLKRQTKDYLFYQMKQKFETNEKKLVDKVNMIKKDSLVTKEELEELANKRNERKMNLIKMWQQRSQKLPIYKHPVVNILEDEELDVMEDEQEKQEQKEKNEISKKTFQPPKVKINKELKRLREKKLLMSNKDSVTQTEIQNKKRFMKNLDFMANIIEAAKEENLEKNKLKNNKNIKTEKNNETKNKIRITKSLDSNENKKKHNYLLHPKPEKPIDYLKEIFKGKKGNKLVKEKKDQGVGEIIADLNEESKTIKGRNQIMDTLDMIKSKTNAIEQKVTEKKDIMKVKGGYINNTNIGDEVGNLLIESIQTKLSLLNKLKGK